MAKNPYNFAAQHMAASTKLTQAGFQFWMMGLEAQAVIAMRLMGMSGFWATAPSEKSRMFVEKPPAFAKAALAATSAAAKGKSPGHIADAAVRPLRSKTRSNARRLSRKGPKLPGR